MKRFWTLILCCTNYIVCFNIDGDNGNSLEFSPIYDAVILNDLVDVFKEFDNNMNFQLDMNQQNSESDESVADLLFEYQQYLDKAHDQHIHYLKKAKTKNKVPLLRHNKFVKKTFGPEKTLDEPNHYYSNDLIFLPHFSGFSSNSYMPNKQNPNYLYNHDHPLKGNSELVGTGFISNVYSYPQFFSNFSYNDKFSKCYCRDNKVPCKCDCKICVLSTAPTFDSIMRKQMFKPIVHAGNSFENQRSTEDKFKDFPNKNFDIRIKVDVQIPKILELLRLICANRNQDLGAPSEIVPINNRLFSYNKFLWPEFYSFQNKMSHKNKFEPDHKTIIHKKKKTRLPNNIKKHKGKKIIPFNLDFLLPTNITTENFTSINHYRNSTVNNTSEMSHQNISITSPKNVSNNYSSIVTTCSPPTQKDISSIETFYITVNLSNSNNNKTDLQEMENSIETNMTVQETTTTFLPFYRYKRDVLNKNDTDTAMKLKNITVSPKSKKLNKMLTVEEELLYWPISTNNESAVTAKNITTLILEKENNKAKLNISYDAIHNNHTKALEKAIFGDTNWDDVDSVVPVFISFVGKYIRGILSFCSQVMCHSMKCADKFCLHRICEPDNRFNHNGHCTGNNNSDSVAALESIMDLPSNVALEIVDILKDKMLGNIYGKATLCIASKCVTFVASKKTFLKSKCPIKELNPSGHCPNISDSKIM